MVYKLNRIGPRTEPRGTPHFRLVVEEEYSCTFYTEGSIHQKGGKPRKYTSINAKPSRETFQKDTMINSIKAADRSSIHLIALVMVLHTERRTVSVERRFVWADWCLLNRSLDDRSIESL